MTRLVTIVCSAILLNALLIHGDDIQPIQPTQCEHYEQKDCDNHGKCDVEIKTCEVTDTDKPSHCYVLWHVNNLTVTMKGCFTHNNVCSQEECIDTAAEPKGNLNFCCCEKSLCNKEFKWSPSAVTTPEPPKIKENNTVTFLVVAAIIFFVFLIIGGIFLATYFFKQRKHAVFVEIPTSEPEMAGSTVCISLDPIQLIEMKARGRFGAVWLGKMKSDDVAVKIVPVQDKESWVTEMEIYKIARMNHLNILEFIGGEKRTENLQTEFWLITTYHHHGSLCDYLKAHTVTWPELCLIAETMARGLTFLHEEIPGTKADGYKPAIAHRDFKSKNVLLKSDLTACIADFGLALVFNPDKPCGDTHGQVGTRRYMAPEVLEGAINFTRDAFLRIDVYACGLVLWELVSRCSGLGTNVPTYALPFEPELGLHPTLEEMQENVVIKKLRPKIEDSWRRNSGVNAICDTMEECWDHDAEARLSSSCVMERLAQHRKYPQTHLLIESNTNSSKKNYGDSV